MNHSHVKSHGRTFFPRVLGHFCRCVAGFLVVILLGCFGFMAETYAATIIIVNKDNPGEGFNDPTAFAPVGGNAAPTLGEARLKAFQYAANILAKVLVSTVHIRVDAQFDSLGPGVLGAAGPNTVHRDFPNAAWINTWYVQALANNLAGQDLDPTTSDMSATFNTNFPHWYFGLDTYPPPGQFDFVTVVLHELLHGLGFLSLVDEVTGEKFLETNDVFTNGLEHHGAIPFSYPHMTNTQRQMANVAGPNLHFWGWAVSGATGSLTAGRIDGHVQMYAPNPVQPGSSVSHFTNIIKPDQLMEPGLTSGKAIHDLGFAKLLLIDLGWSFENGVKFPTRNDVNGDGKADLVWRNTNTGATAIWLMNGSTIASFGSLGMVSLGWKIVGTGDMNADGEVDIIWRNSLTGTVAVWLMHGPTVLSVGFPGSVSMEWEFEGVGDVDGNSMADIFWHHTGSGEVVLWLMSGSTLASSAHLGALPLEWRIAETGDMDGDGKADVIWRNELTGKLAVWLLNGLTITLIGSPGTVHLDWQIASVGDVNGDGKGDLVWRKMSNGEVAIWLMNGSSMTSLSLLGVVNQAWKIANTNDVNGDGHADVIWQHTNGTVAVWLMKGTAIESVGFPASVSLEWRIQP